MVEQEFPAVEQGPDHVFQPPARTSFRRPTWPSAMACSVGRRAAGEGGEVELLDGRLGGRLLLHQLGDAAGRRRRLSRPRRREFARWSTCCRLAPVAGRTRRPRTAGGRSKTSRKYEPNPSCGRSTARACRDILSNCDRRAADLIHRVEQHLGDQPLAVEPGVVLPVVPVEVVRRRAELVGPRSCRSCGSGA